MPRCSRVVDEFLGVAHSGVVAVGRLDVGVLPLGDLVLVHRTADGVGLYPSRTTAADRTSALYLAQFHDGARGLHAAPIPHGANLTDLLG